MFLFLSQFKEVKEVPKLIVFVRVRSPKFHFDIKFSTDSINNRKGPKQGLFYYSTVTDFAKFLG